METRSPFIDDGAAIRKVPGKPAEAETLPMILAPVRESSAAAD